MKNRLTFIIAIVLLALLVAAVRARGGGFLSRLAPMLHGPASH